jgi:predicted lipoprotein with Yx(FWY)xxD motif
VGTPLTTLRIGRFVALAAVVALVAAGLGASSSSARVQLSKPTVTTKKLKHLGTVLVNSRGLTLYMFKPDHQKKVTCNRSCRLVWPPLKIKKGQRPTAGGSARKGLLGTVKNPGGGRVVTYNRWPLYTYILDQRPGQAKGQRTNLNGGLWYVLSPSGKIITKKP